MGDWLKLGRVSNAPTVASNVVAGAVLGGGSLAPRALVPVVLACVALYVAGMFLNDAFDRAWDARHRPERPIPSGRVPAEQVFLAGFGLLSGGVFVLAFVRPAAFGPALGLAALIVVYDAWHKGNPAAPIVMGACRALVYVTAALATGGHLGWPVVVGAILLCAYVAALSWVARADARLGPLVGKLIAGISVLDALVVAACGLKLATLACALAYPLTRRLQTHVPGT
jgi:4-hydroxybenzoate polyprenyltransferase